MRVIISSKKLRGEIKAVSSKSEAHRALIAAALSEKSTKIKFCGMSEDIVATANAVREIGAKVKMQSDGADVTPADTPPEKSLINAAESGSTIRFMLPVAMALCDAAEFTGAEGLRKRPLEDLLCQMEEHGCKASSHSLPLSLSGRLQSGKYNLRGDVSSQYITGLLLALPLPAGDSEINILTPLQSKPYVDMTLNTLRTFGIKLKERKQSFFIPGGQKYKSPGTIEIEGDWSNSAFWLAAGFLGCGVQVTGLKDDSLQGDRAIADFLEKLKGKGEIVISAEQTPDLVPILCVAATARMGITRIINAQRLKIKESDRLLSTQRLVSALGGNISQTDDGLVIRGEGGLQGGEVNGFGDHRIVMSAAVASVACENKVIINGAEAVNKSYPSFWEDFKKLGGIYSVI